MSTVPTRRPAVAAWIATEVARPYLARLARWHVLAAGNRAILGASVTTPEERRQAIRDLHSLSEEVTQVREAFLADVEGLPAHEGYQDLLAELERLSDTLRQVH